jgi:hypothetical protein
LGGVKPWTVENSPPDFTYTDYNLKQLYKNMFVIKKISSNEIAPIVERIDWTSGVTYNYYNDKLDMFEEGSDVKLIRKFYVKNKYDQVFKCIWNAQTSTYPNGKPSTVEPLVDFGMTITDVIILSDGYKWKYLYTIDATEKFKYFDKNYIPVPLPSFKTDLGSNIYKAGTISAINVTNEGSGYTNDSIGDSTTTVTITGDGTGATAKAIVASNKISDVIVTNGGSGYTYATATITAKSPAVGSGATANTSISPIGGNNWDLIKELGSSRVMITGTISDTESGTIPDDIDFRQIGLIANPSLKDGGYANSTIYSMNNNLIVGAGSGTFTDDETVYQSATGLIEDATFTATVLTFDAFNNNLYIINTVGTLQEGLNIKGSSSSTSRLVLNSTNSEIELFSGQVLYVENRKPIQRTAGGVEQFRLVIKF